MLSNYTDRLLTEIEKRAKYLDSYSVDTVYFGGGTPSLLSPEQIGRIIEGLQNYLRFESDNPEITLECNPGDFTVSRLAGYRIAGINRVVLGVQTMNERLHSVIGRSSAICDENLLNDFSSIDGIVHCIDIIVGIPGQSEEELNSDLDKILEYKPEHISAYMLSIEKGTRLYERIVISDDFEELQRRLFKLTIEKLCRSGYKHYEISNFALPSFESRHNLKYWRFMPYAGFGVKAHSFYNSERLYNEMTISDYMTDDVVLVKDERNENQIAAEFLFTGLRMLEGVSLKHFERCTGTVVPEDLMNRVRYLQGSGFLELMSEGDDSFIRLTDDGLFLMDSIIFYLLESLI